jgi:hypothetical protein
MGQKAAGTTKGGQIAARDKSSYEARAKRTASDKSSYDARAKRTASDKSSYDARAKRYPAYPR